MLYSLLHILKVFSFESFIKLVGERSFALLAAAKPQNISYYSDVFLISNSDMYALFKTRKTSQDRYQSYRHNGPIVN